MRWWAMTTYVNVISKRDSFLFIYPNRVEDSLHRDLWPWQLLPCNVQRNGVPYQSRSQRTWRRRLWSTTLCRSHKQSMAQSLPEGEGCEWRTSMWRKRFHMHHVVSFHQWVTFSSIVYMIVYHKPYPYFSFKIELFNFSIGSLLSKWRDL